MIICKRLAPPDDHLQEAGPSRLSFAKGWPPRVIICRRLAPPCDICQRPVTTTTTRGPCGPSKSRVFVKVVFVFSCIIVVAAFASCSDPASRLQRVNWEDSAEEAHNWDRWEDVVREAFKNVLAEFVR